MRSSLQIAWRMLSIMEVHISICHSFIYVGLAVHLNFSVLYVYVFKIFFAVLVHVMHLSKSCPTYPLPGTYRGLGRG